MSELTDYKGEPCPKCGEAEQIDVDVASMASASDQQLADDPKSPRGLIGDIDTCRKCGHEWRAVER